MQERDNKILQKIIMEFIFEYSTNFFYIIQWNWNITHFTHVELVRAAVLKGAFLKSSLYPRRFITHLSY